MRKSSVRGLAFGSWQRAMPPPAAPAPVATPPAAPPPAAPALTPAQASDSSEEYDFVHVVLDSDDEPDAADGEDGEEEGAGPSSSNSDCQILGVRTLEERNAELMEHAVDLDADDESQASSAASLDAVCYACGGAESARGNDIVLCEAVSNDGPCGRAYHQRCLAPPLRTIPADAWHCPRCVEARRAGSWRGAAHDCMPEGRTRPPRIGRCFQVSQSQLASPQAPMPAAAASSPDPREGRLEAALATSSANAGNKRRRDADD